MGRGFGSREDKMKERMKDVHGADLIGYFYGS